jgi:pimeloyl-ACP methyl ester carboxylesterase
VSETRTAEVGASEVTPVPAWFSRAIGAPFTEHVVVVDDCPIHYVRWGDPAKSPVVLVHGGGAHAFWWAFLAPMLADRHSVVALDLSGHGDSGRRGGYPREVWARDIMGVVRDASFASRPVLVGHSMGGFVSIVTAALHGDELAGAILVDSPIRPREPTPEAPEPRAGGWSFQSMPAYPDFESAVQRFRLLPEQPAPLPFLLDFVARKSVRQTPEGFTWKFDPRVFEKTSRSSLRDYFVAARCRLALVRGSESVVLPLETAEFMVGLAPGTVPLIEIPDAHHHLMFDQPLPFLVALRSLLADWECSRPLVKRSAAP